MSILIAAIAIDEASSWANRIKMDAVETNKMPRLVAIIG
jgi:hypothetical protein